MTIAYRIRSTRCVLSMVTFTFGGVADAQVTCEGIPQLQIVEATDEGKYAP